VGWPAAELPERRRRQERRHFWFTDPSYGHLQGFPREPQIGDHGYRFDPRTADLSVVADSFDKPNGLAFSPDESVLYVGDSGANQEPGSFYPDRPHYVEAFDVVDGRQLAAERLFCVTTPGSPTGSRSTPRAASTCPPSAESTSSRPMAS
jgi:gluconolactonase